MFLLPKITFSMSLWKLSPMGSIWFYQKNCRSISCQCVDDLQEQCHCFRARKSIKAHNSRLSGFHGNIFQIFWILGHRHPKGYLSWKFQVSSPNGRAVIMWVTNFDSDKRAIYKLMYDKPSNELELWPTRKKVAIFQCWKSFFSPTKAIEWLFSSDKPENPLSGSVEHRI